MFGIADYKITFLQRKYCRFYILNTARVHPFLTISLIPPWNYHHLLSVDNLFLGLLALLHASQSKSNHGSLQKNKQKSIADRAAKMILWNASQIRSLLWLKPANDSFLTATESDKALHYLPALPCLLRLYPQSSPRSRHRLDMHPSGAFAVSFPQPGMLPPHVSNWLTPSPLCMWSTFLSEVPHTIQYSKLPSHKPLCPLRLWSYLFHFSFSITLITLYKNMYRATFLFCLLNVSFSRASVFASLIHYCILSHTGWALYKHLLNVKWM